jgi:hypothetical protein
MIDPHKQLLNKYTKLVKFTIMKLRRSPAYATHIRYDTLDSAKAAVRNLRKYEKRIFHYVDDVEH